ncbi:MAG TPA: hypothetical protein VFY65_14755 [Longimicrobium sp.]|nr:hypothetical protein [Longimicrobium sp.]
MFLLAAACSDLPTDGRPAQLPASPGAVSEVRCTVSVATAQLSCVQQEPGSGASRTMMTLGGQHRNVRLASSGLSATGGIFSFDVTVQNLLQQPLGTADGVAAHGAGVRVFFVSLQGTGGTGEVTVANPTGVGIFTAADQPYFQYGGSVGSELGADGMLTTGETSLPKRWEFAYGDHTAFTFSVYVTAEVPDPAGAPLHLVQISAGGSHTCGLTAAGKAYCWGYGVSGNLGNGGVSDRNVPVPVTMPDGEVFTQIDGGHSQACAVAASGQAYCWGTASNGVLGTGFWASTTPAAVLQPQGVSFTKISTGVYNTCAIGPSGAYCWGHAGVLGDSVGNESGVPVPVALPAGEVLTDISVGRRHTCGIASSGTTWCWGFGGNGQLGNGGFAYSAVPVPVTPPLGITFTQVVAGNEFTCALAGGAAYCWGRGLYGALGNGLDVDAGVPVAVHQPLGTTFSEVSANFDGVGVCALGNAGLYCWGREVISVQGNFGFVSVPVARAMPAGASVTGISVGGEHRCLLADNGVYCWGWGLSGQLGNGTDISNGGFSATPTPVAGTR